MAHPQIAVFARVADGNAKPVRKIEGQKTLLGRTMHDIRYNPIHDEFVVPQAFGGSILTFRGGAEGEEPPIRVIQGPLTRLTDTDRLAVDPVHNEIFVPQGDAVLVFSREAKGNVAPIRVLEGPDTQLNGLLGIAVDPVRNLLVLAAREKDGDNCLLIFDRVAAGNSKPRAVITGPRTGLQIPGQRLIMAHQIQVYPPRGWIVVAQGLEPPKLKMLGISREVADQSGYVGVWSINDNGDVPPRWTIGGPNGGVIKKLMGVVLDPEHKSVIVSDKYLNAVLTYYFPEIF